MIAKEGIFRKECPLETFCWSLSFCGLLTLEFLGACSIMSSSLAKSCLNFRVAGMAMLRIEIVPSSHSEGNSCRPIYWKPCALHTEPCRLPLIISMALAIMILRRCSSCSKFNKQV